MTITVAAFVAGALFALGLGVAGMTQPAKVLAFLDVGGGWDPSLALVMVGAIGTHALLAHRILRRRAPVLCATWALPARRAVDARLVAGAALFGVGWGLAGFCPGPALTAVAGGRLEPVVFVAAMLTGMALHRFGFERGSRPFVAAERGTQRGVATSATTSFWA